MPNHVLRRSPLRNVDSLLSATLIFVGANDEKVLPEPQGISLHRALSSRFVPTALYHYPGRMSLIGKIYRVQLECPQSKPFDCFYLLPKLYS